jgi:hypothetical protein
MSKKIRQDQRDVPADNGAAPVATEPVNDAPAPAPDGNGQPKEREPKDVRFQRLAVKRVNKALKVLSHVGNLSNRATYAYTDEQAVAWSTRWWTR